MPKPIARVVVNGYGVIGKRVADAVTKQPDMKLVGVSDIVADWRVKLASLKGYTVYASLSEKVSEMKSGGVDVAGALEDLLRAG